VHDADVADGARANDLDGGGAARCSRSLVAHLRGDAMLDGQHLQLARLPDIVRQGFLAIDMLAQAQGRGAGHGVLMVRGADDDGVDVALLVEHDAEILILGRVGEAPVGSGRPALIDIAQGNDVLGGRHTRQVGAAPAADADEGDIEPVIGPQPPRLICPGRCRPEAPWRRQDAGPASVVV